jgi:hypothetical protein
LVNTRPEALLSLSAAAIIALTPDPELAAIARRCYPSDADEARRAREREAENAARRAEDLRELKALVRNAVDGAFGKQLAQEARAILEEGVNEANFQRVRKLVREWRRAGRAKKSASKGKTGKR